MNKLGHGESLAHAEWPKADERYVGQDAVTAVVQIKGKVRAKLEVSPDIDPKELEKMALEAVADRLGGKEPRRSSSRLRRSCPSFLRMIFRKTDPTASGETFDEASNRVGTVSA